jgi:uridine phosphorylase
MEIMIKFDPNKTAIFNPSNLGLNLNIKKALMIFDDEIWNNWVKKQLNTKISPVKTITNKIIDSFFTYRHEREDVLLISPAGGIGGAAMSVVDMELLIRSGINKIVAFGTCGVMDKHIAKNAIIIPETAFREEGVSYHYLPPSDEVEQDYTSLKIMADAFTKEKIKFLKGKVWTTDAVYRETKGKLIDLKNKGCIAIDMEFASLLAVAKFRHINFAGFLIADDNLDFSDKHKKLKRNSAKIFQIALNVVSSL